MRRLAAGLVPLLLALSASPASAQKEFGFDNRKPSGQPYLTPQESLARMKVAPEFEVKLHFLDILIIAISCLAYATVVLPLFLKAKGEL